MLEFIKKLLQKQETHKVPFIQEELKRDEKEQLAYEEWMEIKGYFPFNALLKEQYAKSQEQGSNVAMCTFMSRGTASGFVIYPNEYLDDSEFAHYFDYLHKKVLTLGYRKYLSDYKQFIKQDHIKRIERHYVKPKLTRDPKATQANQRFGNITIELEYKDEKIKYLKLLASVYNDRLYSKALPFGELIEVLVE